MTKVQHVTYLGGPTGLSALVHELEQQGAEVRWERPEQRRSEGGAAEQNFVELAVAGTVAAISTAVDQVRRRDPGVDIVIEDNQETEPGEGRSRRDSPLRPPTSGGGQV